MLHSDILAEVSASGRITAGHVEALRRAVYSDARVAPGELETLFALDEAASGHDPSWTTFFGEAIADLVVEQMEPQGYVSEENADWLVSRIAQDGRVRRATELEVLIKVLEKAKSSPERLSAFALRQVAHAVKAQGSVTRPDVELLRRILYAFGSEGNVAISRAEAEVLFDINDATANAENDAAWSDLFVKAMANVLMASSGYAVPSRQEAMRREAWLDAPTGGVIDVFSRIASGGLRGFLQAYREAEPESAWAERNKRAEESIATAAVVNPEEAEWLASRIGRDGTLHPNEKALLRFIRNEAPSVHPSLQPLLAKAAA